MIVTRCGHVAIVGRPNVGKSTLLNALLGQKISITSRKPQTTRQQIFGIKTHDTVQAIYVDTPGLHIKEKRSMNRLMNRAARATFFDVDLIVLLIEGTRWTDDDENIIEQLKTTDRPIILVINKIDQVKDKAALLPIIERLKSRLPFIEVIPISALKGLQVDTLEKIIENHLPEHAFLFPEGQVTDRSLHFQMAEIVREKIIRHLAQELPYSTTVEIEKTEKTEKIYHIHAIIWVERPGQKSIIIGKGGEKLKEIGSAARRDLERLLGQQVNLQLWVKVKEGWSDNETSLGELGIQ